MRSFSRRRLARLLVAWVVLFSALACGGTTCDCVTPLAEPIAEEAKLYDAVQARLTPQAFDFVESNLTDIITTFLEDGLVFEVPSTDASQEFGWCPLCIKIDITICKNGCTLTAELVEASMSRVVPDTLALDARVNLSGNITIDGTFDCDVPIDIQNKQVQADVRFLIGPDHLLSFEITGVSVELTDDDYELTCDWGFLSDIGLGDLIDDVVNWVAGLLTPMLNDELNSQLDGALDDAMADATCLACDFYTGGCPDSSCNGGHCMSGGQCLTNPLGMIGSMDLGELLADLAGDMQASLELFLVAGQLQQPHDNNGAIVVNDGVEIRMIGGVDTVRNECVPLPDPSEIPSNLPPERLIFESTVPGTGDPYMAGIGVSDAFLDWFMYKVYLTGLLCLSIGTETTDMLSSSTISLMGLGSLNDLTTGRNVPVKLNLKPGGVPYLEVGAGTFTEDEEGNRVIDEPLIYVFLPDVGLDFVVLIDERWTRILTITLDIAMDVALDLDENNMLIPLFGEDSIHFDNVNASNYELLAEDPETLENLIPSLVGMALPMLTGALEPIEIPPIEGFALDITAMKGVKPRPDTDFFEYLGLFANLSLASNPAPPGRETTARVADLRVPRIDLMSIRNPGGPMYPEVLVDVFADGREPAEYSYRVDGGFWRPFTRGPTLRVHDPRLAFIGKHEIEVRARTPGQYRTLDPTPASLTFEIKPQGLEKAIADLEVSARSRADDQPGDTLPGLQTRGEKEALQADEKQGCACGTRNGGSTGLIMLLGIGLALITTRNRRRSG